MQVDASVSRVPGLSLRSLTRRSNVWPRSSIRVWNPKLHELAEGGRKVGRKLLACYVLRSVSRGQGSRAG